MISRPELVLRRAILDVLCSQPDDEIGGHLRQALIDARGPDEHPEDRCEECQEPFNAWHMSTEEWEMATGRAWGGPILCNPCAHRRLKEQPHRTLGRMGDQA